MEYKHGRLLMLLKAQMAIALRQPLILQMVKEKKLPKETERINAKVVN